MLTIDQIKTHARSIPLPLRIGVAGFIALLLTLLLLGHGAPQYVNPPPPVAPRPAPSAASVPASQPVTAPPVPVTVPTAAVSMPLASAATAAAPAVALAIGPVMLPAQPAPANLVRGTTTRALDAAPKPEQFTGKLPTDWATVASVIEQTPTASWSTAPGKTLQSVDPSSGYVRDTWTAWIHVAHDGAHTLVLRLSQGSALTATVTTDNTASPAITASRNGAWSGSGPATTSIATVGLMTGWHSITVQVIQLATDEAATVDLYMRGPAASVPIAIVPSAPAAAVSRTTP